MEDKDSIIRELATRIANLEIERAVFITENKNLKMLQSEKSEQTE